MDSGMTELTLKVRYDDGLSIEYVAADFDELTARWRDLVDVRTLATMTAGGLGPQVVPDRTQPHAMPSDPWGQPPARQEAPQRPPSTFRRPEPPAPPQASTVTVQTPNGLQVWTLAPDGAPSCLCGETSALVHGTNKNGGPYNAYRCAKGSGDQWRTKCDFNKWA
jgi:hypothetical protein